MDLIKDLRVKHILHAESSRRRIIFFGFKHAAVINHTDHVEQIISLNWCYLLIGVESDLQVPRMFVGLSKIRVDAGGLLALEFHFDCSSNLCILLVQPILISIFL